VDGALRMIVMAIFLTLISASSTLELQDASRLTIGSQWQCKHLLNDDNSPGGDLYEADFLIIATENKAMLPSLPKQLIVTKTTGELPIQFTAYGSLNGNKNPFGLAGYTKKYDFIHAFNDWGAWVMVGWWKKKPDMELVISSFNYEFREDVSKRDERTFAFRCLEVTKK
jgi:hypothetical protein